MKFKWLNQQNNDSLIVFCNGWGMDETAINHLDYKYFDILLIYDYSDLKIPEELIKNINSYSDKYLITWSMGVWAAAKTLNNIIFNKKIAINGTLKPINNEFGIAEQVFKGTLDNLSEATRDKFFRRMFLSQADYAKFVMPKRDLENQKQELAILLKIATESKDIDFNYDTVLVSIKDRIMPTKNQINFWENYISIEGGHYPFYNFSNWSEIINVR